MKTFTLLTLSSVLSTTLAGSLRRPSLSNQPDSQTPLDPYDGTRKAVETTDASQARDDMLDAIRAMQDNYFNIQGGTWPDAIDWTAAVVGTHVSATLSGLMSGLSKTKSTQARAACFDFLGWENTVNKYFAHTSMFYYNENAFGLRGQAFDDMLWVVLGWLENIKFIEMYTTSWWENGSRGADWHGLQISPLAAHRARIFYELSEVGWDETLCGGGMVWNPRLEPYKNAITNELFAAASIAMYLYWPGDNNTSPFGVMGALPKQHNPTHLDNALKAYDWMMNANMTNEKGLFEDGYHITGWKRYNNGTIDSGTGQCDAINRMVYTYNQGVVLTASRGLWLATGQGMYLDNGHKLITDVINATGWPHQDRYWKGLGRGGVLEEWCDHDLSCSQDGQTFKGIFFHHLADFCRPLWPQEEELFGGLEHNSGLDASAYERHLDRCEKYGAWIEHNTEAVLKTKNDDGLFGMWWGIPTHRSSGDVLTEGSQDLPKGAVDYKNPLVGVEDDFTAADLNDWGRGRTVETQSSGLAVLRARWQWRSLFG